MFFCLNKCGHPHCRVVRVITLHLNDKTGLLKREFIAQKMDRHLTQTHNLGQSVAAKKQLSEQEKLNSAMVCAVTGQSTGNFSMFSNQSFQTFFKMACTYSKNFRETPDFLNFERRHVRDLVKDHAGKLMNLLKKAVNNKLDKQREELTKGIKPKVRTVCSVFMDHFTIRELKKKLGSGWFSNSCFKLSFCLISTLASI